MLKEIRIVILKKVLIVYAYPLVILFTGAIPMLNGLLYGHHASPGRLVMAGSLIWVLISLYKKFFRSSAIDLERSKGVGAILLFGYFPITYIISLVIEKCITPGEISSAFVRELLLFPLSLLWPF